MTEAILDLVLDEGKWLPTAMFLSFASVVMMIIRHYRQGLPQRIVIVKSMNLFAGLMIGIMAVGHFIGITIKTAMGTLEGSLWILVPLGVVLAVPSWWIVFFVVRFVQEGEEWKRRLLTLNIGLAISLLAVGLNNLPLAVPAGLNIAYLLNSNRIAGWAIVAAMVAAMGGLFVGALLFMASGQSFEQFRSIEGIQCRC